MCILSGVAHASTWTFTGLSDQISGQLSGIEQSQAYYVQFESAAQVSFHLVGITGKQRYWLDPDTEIDIKNYNDFLLAPPQPWGFNGLLVAPTDRGGYPFVTFDQLKLKFDIIPVTDDDGAAPWTFTISTDPIAPPPGVPEPATWALMITGFGLVGTTLRRRLRLAERTA